MILTMFHCLLSVNSKENKEMLLNIAPVLAGSYMEKKLPVSGQDDEVFRIRPTLNGDNTFFAYPKKDEKEWSIFFTHHYPSTPKEIKPIDDSFYKVGSFIFGVGDFGWVKKDEDSEEELLSKIQENFSKLNDQTKEQVRSTLSS